jgi:hypothetical protein
MSKAHRVGALALGITLFVGGGAARARLPDLAVPPLAAAAVVRSYFAALGRQDAVALGAVTAGQAAARTHDMLERIREEAKKRHVGVELQVSSLALAPPVASGDTEQVDTRFAIDVFARKWLFKVLAHKLHGRATFSVGPNLARGDASGAKIVGIKFYID